jgi:hypothetical protein
VTTDHEPCLVTSLVGPSLTHLDHPEFRVRRRRGVREDRDLALGEEPPTRWSRLAFEVAFGRLADEQHTTVGQHAGQRGPHRTVEEVVDDHDVERAGGDRLRCDLGTDGRQADTRLRRCVLRALDGDVRHVEQGDVETAPSQPDRVPPLASGDVEGATAGGQEVGAFGEEAGRCRRSPAFGVARVPA